MEDISDEKDALRRMPMKELSSPLTFFYKFVFPLFWFVGFGFGARGVLFAQATSGAGWLQYMVLWLGVTVFIIFTTGNIKKVRIEGDKLIVSNFSRTEMIDIDQVEGVDGTAFLSPKMVWLNMRDVSPFGRKIPFLPKHRLGSGLGKHPLVKELRQELGLGG